MYHALVKNRLLSVALLYLLMSAVSFLATPIALSQETSNAPDSLMNGYVTSSRLSFLYDLSGGLGSYDKLPMEKRTPLGKMAASSAATFLRGEAGLKIYCLGLTYHLEILWTERGRYGREEYVRDGDRVRHGMRAFCQLAQRDFILAPEGGYTFVEEWAGVIDRSGQWLDRYDQKQKEQGYCYGLSARLKVIPFREGGAVWLYGRYVRDDMETDVDNYWIKAELGALNSDPPWVDQDPGFMEYAFLSLGVRWANRTDGRSEWFITARVEASLGLL